jgi:hypothetical protein
MKDLSTTRRGFLAGSAAAVAAISLAACGSGGDTGTDTNDGDTGAGAGKGSSADPLPKPAKFQESPLVAAEVQSGGLPPIEESLPENPYVIPHKWAQPGKYGGKLKMNVTGYLHRRVRHHRRVVLRQFVAAVPQRRPGHRPRPAGEVGAQRRHQ